MGKLLKLMFLLLFYLVREFHGKWNISEYGGYLSQKKFF